MRGLVMTSVMAGLVFAAAAAQAAPLNRQEVKVPFSFVVNGQELPAGTYSVQVDDMNGGALLLRGDKASAYLLTAPLSGEATPSESSLVFAKENGQYHLAQVWNGDSGAQTVVSAR